MKNFNVKAVIFDMDGVITNTMPDHYRAWVKTLTEIVDIYPTKLDIYLKEGAPGIDCLCDIFKKYQKPYDDRIAQKCLKAKEEYFKKIVQTRFIPNTRAFLKQLNRNNIKLALVTGTSRDEVHRILPDKVFNLFSVVVTGNDVKRGKPFPEPYLKALEQLNVKNTEAVVIENAPFGIESAKAANLKCLALETSLPSEYLAKADLIFRSIKDMLKSVSFTPLL